ncbi:MAG TPA: hypothetical protein VMJ34_05380 [Bryobacteraceae bacterium]|nr:hypothetical protein [Bryobacteraceae bacterium]
MRFFVPLLFVAALTAQPATRTRVFASLSKDALEASETTGVIRVIAGVTATLNEKDKTITVTGPVDQMALAEWLFQALDGPVRQRPVPKPGQKLLVREYRASADDIVHVIYLPELGSLQHVQEVVTAARSVSGVLDFYTSTRQEAVITRGRPGDLALADWICTELTAASAQPAPQSVSMSEYAVAVKADHGVKGDAFVRVYTLPNFEWPYGLQEVITTVRSLAYLAHLYVDATGRAVTARGNREQLALADWLFRELDRAASQPEPHRVESRQYKTGDELVRLFFLMRNVTPEQVEALALRIRTSTQMTTIFTVNSLRAIAMRGTPEQIAEAGRLIAATGD